MPHFHLNLSNNAVDAPDVEGIDAANLDEARDHAIVGIRGFLSHELAHGVLDLRGRIDITDEEGTRLMTVPFDEAVRVVED